MFILRRITKDCIQTNIMLGDRYQMISDISSPDEFEKALKRSDVVKKDTVHAFVVTENGNRLLPLFKGQATFIMAETGRTFENCSR